MVDRLYWSMLLCNVHRIFKLTINVNTFNRYYDTITISYYIVIISIRNAMLEVLLGTKNRELTLQYLLAFNEGYAREIARYLNAPLPSIQNQLKNFENGGLALSKMSGRTKVYFINPKYAFIEELAALLSKAKEYYKPDLKEKFEMQRKRPRRPEKPL